MPPVRLADVRLILVDILVRRGSRDRQQTPKRDMFDGLVHDACQEPDPGYLPQVLILAPSFTSTELIDVQWLCSF
jgi:hypothetical protein